MTTIKVLALILVLSMMATMLAGCNLFPCSKHADANGDSLCDNCGERLQESACNSHVDNNEDGMCDICGEICKTEDPTDGESPEPTIKGDYVVILDKNTAFSLVYPAGEAKLKGFANDLATKAGELKLETPAVFSDSSKTEKKCELLIGETNRPLSTKAKAALADKISAEPDANHWIWLYENGQLALYAGSDEAYDLAVTELFAKYYTAGEVKMMTNTDDFGYVGVPHEAYMSYDIPDNFYDGYTDPFAEIISEYKEVKVTLATANKYTIDCIIDADNYYRVEFVRKKWGMWMLGGMHICEGGTLTKLTSTSTDYEFVMTCSNKGEYVAHGGNHGDYGLGDNWNSTDSAKSNDRLLDMTFYNAQNGEKIALTNVGDSVTVKGLRLVMHHNLYELEYSKENVLVNVENSYLFSGFDVFCATNIYAVQDLKVKNVRTAMLPVMKEYGNCIMLYNTDGTTTYAKTSPIALGSGYNHTVGGFDATKIEVWGEEHPEYHLTLQLYNPGEMLMHNFGTIRDDVSIRDMNGGATNKIYCTSFATDGEMVSGTEYNYVASWSFSIDRDFEQPTREPDVYVIKGK